MNPAELVYKKDDGWETGMYIKGICPLHYSKEDILKETGYNYPWYMAHFKLFIKKENYIEFRFGVFTD